MSNNPYESPVQFPADGSMPSGQPNFNAMAKVSGPATGLMVVGIISSLFALFGFGMAILTTLGMNPMMANQEAQMRQIEQDMDPNQAEMFKKIFSVSNAFSGPVSIFTNGIVIAVGIYTVLTAQKMKRLESHTMCIVFSALACIPCTNSCCIIGLPIGIWSIIVLVDANVKGAFRS